MMVKHENLESDEPEKSEEYEECEDHEEREDREEHKESEERVESKECEMRTSGRCEVSYQVLEWWAESQTLENWAGLSVWEVYLQGNKDLLDKRTRSKVQWAQE